MSMRPNRPSFQQWLEKEYKMKGKTENTSKVGDLNKGAGANFLFQKDRQPADSKDIKAHIQSQAAQKFIEDFKIVALAQRMAIFNETRVIFEDSMFPDFASVYLSKENSELGLDLGQEPHDVMRQKYAEKVKATPLPATA